MKKTIFIWVLTIIFIGAPHLPAAAEPEWRSDFDRICAHTAGAGKLTATELTGLIEESDKLLKVIQASDNPEKKVYLIRLKKCRSFFDFMRSVSKK